jgi:hypothetical protein
MCVYAYICLYVLRAYSCVHTYVCACVCGRVYICMYVYVCAYICMYICVCVYIYIYIYIYIYVYTHTHSHSYIIPWNLLHMMLNMLMEHHVLRVIWVSNHLRIRLLCKLIPWASMSRVSQKCRLIALHGCVFFLFGSTRTNVREYCQMTVRCSLVVSLHHLRRLISSPVRVAAHQQDCATWQRPPRKNNSEVWLWGHNVRTGGAGGRSHDDLQAKRMRFKLWKAFLRLSQTDSNFKGRDNTHNGGPV